MTPQEGATTAARPTAEDIGRLDEKMDRLGRELRETEAELRTASLAYWGCKIGDPVRESVRRREPRTGTIVSVYRASGSAKNRPWVNVRLNKKDGTPGERIVNFYDDWERVEDSATDAA